MKRTILNLIPFLARQAVSFYCFRHAAPLLRGIAQFSRRSTLMAEEEVEQKIPADVKEVSDKVILCYAGRKFKTLEYFLSF